MGNHLPQEIKFSTTFPEQNLTLLLRPRRLCPHLETSLGRRGEESTVTKNMSGPDSGAGDSGGYTIRKALHGLFYAFLPRV